MNLAGVFAPIPTPFDDRDRVDTARLRAALARWVTRPLTGFVILGSNGEAVLMDDFESDQVIVAAIFKSEAIPEKERLDLNQVVTEIKKTGKHARILPDADAIVQAIAPELRSGDVVAILANGGFGGIYEKLPERLRALGAKA